MKQRCDETIGNKGEVDLHGLDDAAAIFANNDPDAIAFGRHDDLDGGKVLSIPQLHVAFEQQR